MSFPIDYLFYGESISIKYKQVGNAVPPKMAYAFASAIVQEEKTMLANDRYIPIKRYNDQDFINLNYKTLKITKEKPRLPNSRFKYHIPYLKLKTFRVELTNHHSDFLNKVFKWDVEIHRSQGKKATQYTPEIESSAFTDTEFQLINSFSKRILCKDYNFSKFQEVYCMIAKDRKKNNLMGPNELLEEVKKFIKISFLNKENLREIMITDIPYPVPKSIIIGYYTMKLIISNMELGGINDKRVRVKKLAEIQANDTPYMTGVRINYKGVSPFNVFKIPLEYLIYNKYNGRIGSLVKSFEKQDHPLDAEKDDDKKIIEKFLWDSKLDRNKNTEDSLIRDGQRIYGIVTNDGMIIDGNRRAMLLNKIYLAREIHNKNNNNVENCKYFIAAILPEGAETKEIVKLETEYQMGEDEKVDYNPIEKYLRCKDLKIVFGFEESDIAKMMATDKNQIKEWLKIMEMMNDYLSYLKYEGIYTRLDKREGQFVNLSGYMERYENKSTPIEWPYSELDLSVLKSICYDYIRAQYEGKEFRNIAKPSKNESIFSREEVWKEFEENHKNNIETIQEKPIEELREENPKADLSKILSGRDEDWEKLVEDKLKENLGKAKSRLDDLNKSDQPMELLVKALNALNSLNTDTESFYSSDVESKICEINSITYEFKKMIAKRRKSASN